MVQMTDSYYTIDPYYDIAFFNESKEALKNNNTDFEVFIEIKQPFNWYFKLNKDPIMVNYDKITVGKSRWLVNTIIPLRPNEEYLLLRRNNDHGKSALLNHIENDPMKEARKSDYAVFFHVGSREEILNISADYPGKIWFMGKYMSGRYKVFMCTHPIIETFLDKEQILLKKDSSMNEPGRFESEFNYRVLLKKDNLIKFFETPYVLDGRITIPKMRSDFTSRFTI